MHDFVSLLPLLIVAAGAITLMLLSAWEKIAVEQASLISMAFYALAFFVQLLVGRGPETVVFANVFNGLLVSSNFTIAASLVILGCGFFRNEWSQLFPGQPFLLSGVLFTDDVQCLWHDPADHGQGAYHCVYCS